MELSLFLAQLLGTFFTLFGVLMILRGRVFREATEDLVQSKAVQMIAGVFELSIGLAIIISHNVWVLGFEVIITIIGWLFVFESLIYLSFSRSQIKSIFTYFDGRGWITAVGVICIVVGGYLASVGFSLL